MLRRLVVPALAGAALATVLVLWMVLALSGNLPVPTLQ